MTKASITSPLVIRSRARQVRGGARKNARNDGERFQFIAWPDGLEGTPTRCRTSSCVIMTAMLGEKFPDGWDYKRLSPQNSPAANGRSGRCGLGVGLRGKNFRQLAQRQRTAIVEALYVRAAEPANKLELLLRFHAFGGGRHVQAFGETGDRLHDRIGVGTLAQPLDEAAVDLDLVERKAAQVAQRRIAGAEIIH